MKVINESTNVIKNELLPDILKRIFAVCKEDPDFYLKNKVETVEESIIRLEKRVEKNNQLVKDAEEISSGLQKRIDIIEEKNIKTKSRLLEELGSEL